MDPKKTIEDMIRELIELAKGTYLDEEAKYVEACLDGDLIHFE